MRKLLFLLTIAFSSYSFAGSGLGIMNAPTNSDAQYLFGQVTAGSEVEFYRAVNGEVEILVAPISHIEGTQLFEVLQYSQETNSWVTSN